MTRAYQPGHARKVLRIEMLLPLSVTTRDDGRVEEERAVYELRRPATGPQEKFPENFLTEKEVAA